MKVLNLRCAQQHSFEGWFGSEDDFQSQLKRGLIECPMCADSSIQKTPSAPRLNFGGHHDQAPASSNDVKNAASTSASAVALESGGILNDRPVAGMSDVMSADAQADFLKVLRQVLAKTEDVGSKFADEARRMHYGEVEARSIRGQASTRETVELLEEGIEVLPLPLLPALKETLQ